MSDFGCATPHAIGKVTDESQCVQINAVRRIGKADSSCTVRGEVDRKAFGGVCLVWSDAALLHVRRPNLKLRCFQASDSTISGSQWSIYHTQDKTPI
jgi:hypothetical protein